MTNNNLSYIEYFNNNRVLFCSNGDNKRTPSLPWSLKTYENIVSDNLYICKSNKWGYDAFIDIFKYAIAKKYHYVIYIDADCFICNIQNMKILFEEFKTRNFVFGGMPDGGAQSIRIHNKFLINPFFSFYNIDLIKPTLSQKINKEKVLTNLSDENSTYLDECLKKTVSSPDVDIKFNIDKFEPYYSLFTHILTNNRIMYFISKNYNIDDLTPLTGIHVDDAEDKNLVCLHSWYARDNTKKNLDRIYKIYQKALSME